MRFGLPSAGRGLGGRDARLGLPRGVPGIAARACAGAVKRWGLVAAPFANEQFCGSGHKKNEPMGVFKKIVVFDLDPKKTAKMARWPHLCPRISTIRPATGPQEGEQATGPGVARAWRGLLPFPPGYCPWPARCSPVVRCALPTYQRSGAWAARGCEISAPDDGFFCFFLLHPRQPLRTQATYYGCVCRSPGGTTKLQPPQRPIGGGSTST
eukprot:gene18909-biopygen20481